MIRASLLAGLLLAAPAAHAAEVAGVSLPETREVDGAVLRLNGIGARVFSVFRVAVYVAGLYLERPSRDADAILGSPGRKLIEVRYLREVGQDDVRRAWRHLLEANCPAPCAVPQPAVERFLALSPAVRAGSSGTYIFSPAGVAVMADGRVLGTVPGEAFARLALAAFIGAAPTAEALKRALLGLPG